MNSQTLKFIFLVIIASIYACDGYAQSGFPSIQNFSPKEYRSDDYLSSPQNWGVIEDDHGRMFISNTNGVFVYDGVHWQQVAGTEDLWLFKFAKDSSGVIFTGGKDEIGLFFADSLGKLVFKSLTDRLPAEIKDFSRVYSCLSFEGSIFFRTDKYIISWNGNGFNYWPAEGKLLQILTDGTSLYACKSTGLYKFDGSSFYRLFDHGSINNLRIKGVLSEGSGPDEQLILISSKQGIHRANKKFTSRVPSALDSMTVFNCTLTSGGDLAIGTNGHGLLMMDKTGRLKAKFDQETKLQGNQVVFPYEDSHGGIWVALFNGVSRINYNSPVTTIDKDHGLISFASSIKEINGVLYIGTLNGFYALNSGSDGWVSVSKGTGISGAVWDLMETDGKIFAVGERGVSEILEGFEATPLLELENVGATLIPKSADTDLIVSQYDGTILQISESQGKWKVETEVAKLPHNIYSLQQDQSGNIWAAYDGVSRITIDPNRADFEVLTLDSTMGLTEEMGLIQVVKIDGKIYFGSEIGLLQFDEEAGKLVPSQLLGERFFNGSMAYNITQTRAGDVWLTTENHTGLMRKQSNGTFKYDSLPLITSGVSDIWSIFEDSRSRVWFGGTEALVCYDPNVGQAYNKPFHTLIHKVILGEDSVIFNGFYGNEDGTITSQQPESYVFCHPFRYNDLSFQFAAPFFEGMEQTKYSFKLEGQQDSWSAWTSNSSKEYTNLSGGDYIFRVRARNAYGNIGEEASYSFSVEHPWYLRSWAIVLYFVLGGTMIWAAIAIATYRLKKSKIELENIVAQRTSEIRENMNLLEKQKEEINAERLKSDNLLLNILPKETAVELKEKGAAQTKQFDSVTVLFTDFKNFTKISEYLSPDQLVNEINICFSAFDEISDKFGLEKIKTIGDSYMCAGGLPVPNESHAMNTVLAALEMQDFILKRMVEKKAAGTPFFEMRCGIHTGPVVAGVVGVKKFQYDIWGDTVNLASRMESSGEIGKVNVSESTYLLIKDKVNCTFRGEVEAKNKGSVKMYFVESSNT